MNLNMQEKTRLIMKENEAIIVSKRDSKIFFDAIIKPATPNKELQLAAKKYKVQSVVK